MNVDDLSKTQDAAIITGFLPYLERELAALERTVEERVYKQINEGIITPEFALQSWIEKRSYSQLIKRLKTRVIVGNGAAAKMPALDNS